MWCSPFIYKAPEEMRTSTRELMMRSRADVAVARARPDLRETLSRIVRSTVARALSLVKQKSRPLPKRIELARSENASCRDLIELVRDPSPLVRMEVAWNRASSFSVLSQLRHDKDSAVSTVARRRLMAMTGFDQ